MTPESSGPRFEVYRPIGSLPELVLLALASAGSKDVEQGKDWLGNLIDTVFPEDWGIAFYALFEHQGVPFFATNSLASHTEMRAWLNNLAGDL